MKLHERRALIRTKLAAGHSPTQIAQSLGVSRGTVYRAMSGKGTRAGDRAAYHVVTGRVTGPEREALDRLVREADVSTRAAMLRRLVRCGSDFYAPNPDEEAFLRGVEQAFRRANTNLNQIAKALQASVKKIGRADPTRDQIRDIKAMREEISLVRTTVQQMLDNHQVRTQVLRDRLVRDELAGGGDG